MAGIAILRKVFGTRKNMPIVFEKNHLVEIQQHGEAAFPHECCGFLLGRIDENRRVVVQTRRAPNHRADSPQNRYQISPQDYMQTDREARQAGLEIIGFYHSHPDHPARPSQFDLENAWPAYVYVITSVNAGKAEEMTAWILADDRSEFLHDKIVTQTTSSVK
jgi:proteasome lid subunit RPN8/RPN11